MHRQLIHWFGFVLVLFVATTAFAQNKVTITEKARQHFKAGVAYVEDPAGAKYEEAYREFRIAYAESPSYKILTNLGLCALNLERDGEAIAAYEEFLSKAAPGEIPAEQRKIMEQDVATLEASLVTLTLTSTPPDVTLLDERVPTKGSVISNRYDVKGGSLRLGIHPGHHRITAKSPGFQPETWEFEADSASSHQHEFKLVAVGEATEHKGASDPSVKVDTLGTSASTDSSPRVLSTPFYVSAIATGVFAIGSTATTVMMFSKEKDYNRVNDRGDNVERAEELADQHATYKLLTGIGLGATALSAGATIYFYLTAPRRAEARPSATRLRVIPVIEPQRGGVVLTTTF
ncbi:MAG: hypothetical protein QM784_31890 [Polyangiaceae bacterium]